VEARLFEAKSELFVVEVVDKVQEKTRDTGAHSLLRGDFVLLLGLTEFVKVESDEFHC